MTARDEAARRAAVALVRTARDCADRLELLGLNLDERRPLRGELLAEADGLRLAAEALAKQASNLQ